MQIEFVGCTGAGKSTLVQNTLEAYRQRGLKVSAGDDFVLSRLGLAWVGNRFIRTVAVDLTSLLFCLIFWRTHARFYRFAAQITRALPAGRAEKLNLTRNVFKKIGIYEFVRLRGSEHVVIVDEGTLHAAHNLFVHVAVEPDLRLIEAFARLVPLPDAAIYVKQDEPVLIERVIERGHKRIPDRPDAGAERRFIRNAVRTFEELAKQETVKGRLIVVDPQLNVLPPTHHEGNQSLVLAAEVMQNGIARFKGMNPGSAHPSETA